MYRMHLIFFVGYVFFGFSTFVDLAFLNLQILAIVLCYPLMSNFRNKTYALMLLIRENCTRGLKMADAAVLGDGHRRPASNLRTVEDER